MVHPLWLDDCVKQQRRVDPKEKNDNVVSKNPFKATTSHRGTQGWYRYLLSVLAQDRVSTTGFSAEKTEELQHKIEILGGCYDQDLKTATCTVLIARRATGIKFEVALRNSVTTVSEQWLEECILQGSRAKPEDFCLPIPADKGQLSSPHASQSQHSQGTQQSWLTNSTEGGHKDASGSYFEDFKIFLSSDIEGSERSDLLKLCRAAMATTISADPSGLPRSFGITHIVSRSPVLTDELLYIQDACDLSPPCISSDWLRQCSREMRCVDWEAFILQKEPTVLVPPHRRQPGPGSMTRTVSRASASGGDGGCGRDARERKPTPIIPPGIEDTSHEHVPSSVHGLKRSVGDPCISGGRHLSEFQSTDSGDIYHQQRDAVGASGCASLVGAGASFADAAVESPSSQVAPESSGSSGVHQCALDDLKIFQGVGFIISDLLDKAAAADLTKLINEAGGSILSANSPSGRNAGDYEVKSLGSSSEQANAQPTFGCRFLPRKPGSRRVLVSEYWVRKCCAIKKLLPSKSHNIYSPLNRPLVVAGADDVKICISGIHGPAKRLIIWLASQCGVKISEEMKKSTTTHLLACTPIPGPSEKQLKAAEWGIQITSLAWLEDCVCHGSMQENAGAFPPGQELDYVPVLPPAERAGEAQMCDTEGGPPDESHMGEKESAPVNVQPQIDPVIQLQAARNSAILRRPTLQFATVDSGQQSRSSQNDGSPKASGWETGDLGKNCLKNSGRSTRKATKNTALANTTQNDCVGTTSSDCHSQMNECAGAGGVADSRGRCTTMSSVSGRKRKSACMDDILSQYKHPKSSQSALPVSVLAAKGAYAIFSSEYDLSSRDGIAGGSPPGSQASTSQAADPDLSANDISTTLDSQPAVCDAEELAQVMQTLADTITKPPPLSVTRRRNANQAQVHAAISPSGAYGHYETGRGIKMTAGDRVQKKTPQTAARGRQSASGACVTSQMRGRVTKSPCKMMLRGRKFARHISSEDEDEGFDFSDSDDSQEVTYANNEGQRKIQELAVRAQARALARRARGAADAGAR